MTRPGEARARVLVVGGGPVGMLLAAELAALGTEVVLVEGRTTTSERPKATTLHARTVQCLARRGHLPDHLAQAGGDANTMPFHFAGIPGLAITAPPTEPQPVLKVPQAEWERHFEGRARAAGARVLRGHRVVGLDRTPEGVRVEAQGPRGTVTLHARYAVGADGARSTVRRLAGIESDTWPATATALMGQVRLRDEHARLLPPGWHRTPRGWLVVKEAADGSTHLRTLNCDRPPGDRERPVTLAELSQEVSYLAGHDITLTEGRWLSRFSDFSRLARTFRAGPVFLAGDAAHVHFPVGGQGLSTGLLDAVGLGWKLALAAAGDAGDELLDTYDAERRPAARRVVDNTRAQVALMRPDPALDPLRDLIAGMLTSGEDGSGAGGADGGRGGDAFGLMISAQDTVLPTRSPSSSWEGTFLRNVALDTAEGPTDVIRLLREGRPLLLLLGEDGERHLGAARPWAHRLRVVRCAPVPDLPCEALLVRPDGYVGWAPDGGALDAVLARCFGGRGVPDPPEALAAAGPGQPTG
ncbi:FAD-dependent monooxygenase [Streptomyces lavendofoliae]|uniref:Oxygenase n=1 Tax=Streptomyces lavendofoliae TaxID=67314 RepID=A0A918HXL4_9ACTN|nr:FAD-dependent monooxygenase [Streptomyces lavendofoliae]GGU38337.1 putative oxygenase [Streptomyces lavendofoliae]